MSSPQPNSSFTQEPQFEHAFTHTISRWWQNREEGFVLGHEKRRLYWCKLTSPTHQKAILLVNGRIECAWKYQEVLYDLFAQGFDVYSYDHRGQGLSDRLITNSDIGHVAHFQDYVSDLATIIGHFDWSSYQQRLLIGHSMGGAIVTRYLQCTALNSTLSTPFDGAILSAPMHGIRTPWYLKPIATPLTALLSVLASQPRYAPGHCAYYAKPFDGNLLTHSAVRYHWFRTLYDARPELQVGGPSSHWVWQSLLAAKQCVQLARHLPVPLLLLQAEDDVIVDNRAQDRFIQSAQRSNAPTTLLRFARAKHELLFERDDIRNQVLEAIIDFSKQLAANSPTIRNKPQCEASPSDPCAKD
ncbi:alpha/beta fold hydrolase [Vibrio sp. SM6]|uniref:Alpha/beta fold hydrolase n=1 Tax=Vibrio agarilyticus TaxID=2726741 RepID=A0A7X8YHM2_9VIBR|nr:alpha/beta fold hydrolase [Vibrio agarilyticus]NLS13646.1 alpha/beta fold hydrolase [Vibrio agarilyticus]